MGTGLLVAAALAAAAAVVVARFMPAREHGAAEGEAAEPACGRPEELKNAARRAGLIGAGEAAARQAALRAEIAATGRRLQART